MYYGEFQSLTTLEVGRTVRLRRPSNVSVERFRTRVNNATNHFARTRGVRLSLRTDRLGVTVRRLPPLEAPMSWERERGLKYGNPWD